MTRSKAKRTTKEAIGRAKNELAAATKRARGRLDALVALIEQRKASIAREFFEIGASLREIESKKLYVAAGATSFDGWLATAKPVDRATAYRLIEIATCFTRDQTAALNPTNAYALARYSDTAKVSP